MAKNISIAIITSQNDVIKVIKKNTSYSITTLMPDVPFKTSFLKEWISYVIGTSSENPGTIEYDFVLIDALWPDNNKKYFICENLFDDLLGDSGSIVSMLFGAGIPVGVIDNGISSQQAWQLGNAGAQIINLQTIEKQISFALSNLPYSKHTLEVENEFALKYDEIELSGAATVSAIIWENEYVMKHVLKVIDETPRQVKILDLGCGTGRFEEILMANKHAYSKISRIDAIDFAPNYLQEAQKRLVGIFGKEALKKIRFFRRIAEDSRLPAEYYDIVIGSFGIICFSKFHLTLPEIHRILRPGGLLLLNGYNRNAITFDFDNAMRTLTGDAASHFAIKIDRKENKMFLSDKIIQCFTFHVDDLEGILRLIGFHPIEGESITFPALYGCARKEYLIAITNLTTSQQHNKNPKFASYQDEALRRDQFNSGYCDIIDMMDRDLTRIINGRGFYFCIASHKRKSE